MSKKRSGLRRTSILLICGAVVGFGRAASADSEPAHRPGEPRAPNILELVKVAGGEAEGSVALEALVRPAVDGEVQLEVMSPAGLRFQSGARSLRFRIRRGGEIHRARLQVELSALQPTVVRVRAKLLDADGQPWLSLERELRFNQRSPDLSRLRIPIVRTAPDGSRTVEYMERGEAERRGFLPEGSGAPGAAERNPRAPTARQPEGGDDPPAVENVQE